MSFDFSYYESDPEELENLHKRFRFGDKISNNSIAVTKEVAPLVCYSLINLTDKNYGFGQEEFDHTDALYYLERMKTLTSKSIFDIIEDEDYNPQDWHLNQTRGRNIREAIREHFKITKNFEMPEIFHFALYPKQLQQTPSREQKIKNPRVHFIVGANGMIYPLFYDPYHEINPIPAATSTTPAR